MTLGDLLSRALDPAPPADERDDALLDAALDEVAAHGTKGATMDAVARRAGLSRITVFRRFGSKDALLERLVLRELRRFLGSVEAVFEDVTDPADRVVEAFVLCVRLRAGHPLVARLALHDPGGALDRLRRGDPSPLELGRAFVAGHLGAQGFGERDADAVADALVRLATTYVLVPSSVVDVTDERAARRFARAVLAPMVLARPAG